MRRYDVNTSPVISHTVVHGDLFFTEFATGTFDFDKVRFAVEDDNAVWHAVDR